MMMSSPTPNSVLTWCLLVPVARRKPGPKPRRVPQTPPAAHSPGLSPAATPGAIPPGALPALPPGLLGVPGSPSASLAQLFAAADTRPDDSDSPTHKDGRPRNLGRGVSKPKKNTVASLLAQSRALGIKPSPNMDLEAQFSFLRNTIAAAEKQNDIKGIGRCRCSVSGSSSSVGLVSQIEVLLADRDTEGDYSNSHDSQEDEKSNHKTDDYSEDPMHDREDCNDAQPAEEPGHDQESKQEQHEQSEKSAGESDSELKETAPDDSPALNDITSHSGDPNKPGENCKEPKSLVSLMDDEVFPFIFH